MHTSLSLHFIDLQCLDMFWALLAPSSGGTTRTQNWWLLCAVVDVGWSQYMGSLPVS
jgi:hypothetical protein